MKNITFVLILFLLCNVTHSQSITQINKQLDSLYNLRKNIQIKVKDLQDQLNTVNSKINTLETKKASISNTSSTNDNDDIIVAKITSGGAILRDTPNSMGKTLATIPGNETINVYKVQQNLYLKVLYKGQTGYVSYSTIQTNQELDDFIAGKEPVKQPVTTSIVRTVNENDPRFQKLVKLYGHENAVKIINGELWQGMSYGMVLESIGKPNSKNSNNAPDGVKEKWLYSDYTLNFINGELKNWKKK